MFIQRITMISYGYLHLPDLMAARLIGHPDARKRRERLSELLTHRSSEW